MRDCLNCQHARWAPEWADDHEKIDGECIYPIPRWLLYYGNRKISRQQPLTNCATWRKNEIIKRGEWDGPEKVIDG